MSWYVLSFLLQVRRELVSLMSAGRAFHARGPATEDALSGIWAVRWWARGNPPLPRLLYSIFQYLLLSPFCLSYLLHLSYVTSWHHFVSVVRASLMYWPIQAH